VNLPRRCWHVYADPAGSETASLLKVMVPASVAGFVYHVAAPEGWPPVAFDTLTEVVLWCALLWVVRQRDDARAALKATGVAKR
jgi:hypothetical protein